MVCLFSTRAFYMFSRTAARLHTWREIKQTSVRVNQMLSQVPWVGWCVIAERAVEQLLSVVASHVRPHPLCPGAPVIARVTLVCFLLGASYLTHLLAADLAGWIVILVTFSGMPPQVHLQMLRMWGNIIALVAFVKFLFSFWWKAALILNLWGS